MTNSIKSSQNVQIRVPFHGAELFVVEHNGEPYTPMKPIVEGIGIDWRSQATKLRENAARWGVVLIATPSLSGEQNSVCLPLRKLAGWLMTLHPTRVKPEHREKIVAYQNECDDALWQYWTEGVAVNPRMAFSVNPGDILSADQQETLRLMVKTLVERLPKAQQAGAAIKVWSKLKAHFKVAYRQIPQSEFTEAVSIVTRTASEWEVVDPEPEPAKLDERLRDAAIGLCTHMGWVREWWREYGDAIRALNPNAAAAVHDHFVDGVMFASAVGSFVDFRFPSEYARRFPWRATTEERWRYSMTARIAH